MREVKKKIRGKRQLQIPNPTKKEWDAVQEYADWYDALPIPVRELVDKTQDAKRLHHLRRFM
jgi:hypothetical protein